MLGVDTIVTKINLYRPETKKRRPETLGIRYEGVLLSRRRVDFFLFKDSELFVLNISRFIYDKLIDQLGVQVSETAKELLAQLETPLPHSAKIMTVEVKISMLGGYAYNKRIGLDLIAFLVPEI